ncbi:MAG: hypothetical protein GXO76_04030 [Calditrichaeota bacterium]|nr:hypothetical protein [Calditrichota bacterium]
MKRLEKMAVGLLFVMILFSGCSKDHAKQKAAETADTTTTCSPRADSLAKEPRNFKSIHQLELEQHEKDSLQKSSPEKQRGKK